MRISQAFPSKYLKASDLPEGAFVPVVIDRIEIENVAGENASEEHKPVLYFRGKQKGVVLNKTNAGAISGAYGDETEDWIGKNVLLYSTETLFQGQMVPCVRIKIPKGGPSRSSSTATPARAVAAAVTAPAPAQVPFGEEEVFKDDDIPF